MIKWYFAMAIGVVSLLAGYSFGKQTGKYLLDEAKKIMVESMLVLRRAEEFNRNTKEILNEQQREGSEG